MTLGRIYSTVTDGALTPGVDAFWANAECSLWPQGHTVEIPGGTFALCLRAKTALDVDPDVIDCVVSVSVRVA
jgi:hypothetical protein